VKIYLLNQEIYRGVYASFSHILIPVRMRLDALDSKVFGQIPAIRRMNNRL